MLNVFCEVCHHPLTVDRQVGKPGRQIRCPQCKAVFFPPLAPEPEPASATTSDGNEAAEKLRRLQERLSREEAENRRLNEKLKEIQQAADFSNNYVETILASMVDALLVLDEDSRIRTVNHAVLSMLELPENEILGRSLGKIMSDDQADLFLRTLLYEGYTSDFESQFVSGSGRLIPVYLSGSLMLDGEDNILGIVCVAKDISDLKRSQTQLLESEKMATIGKLVAGVAHEINTPVGVGITAASNLTSITDEIRKAFADRSMTKNQLDEYFGVVAKTAKLLLDNLTRTGNLVRSFKMVSADQASEVVRPFDLRSYLSDILASLEPRLKKTPHRVSVECSDPIDMVSYPGAIGQIVTNLVMNSLMHAFSEGVQGQIVLNARQEGDDVLLVYTDDGRGISEADLEKIFEPFFTTNRNAGGTGLGLSIIYNLVSHSLKGTIGCRSVVGKGTSFIMRFPARLET